MIPSCSFLQDSEPNPIQICSASYKSHSVASSKHSDNGMLKYMTILCIILDFSVAKRNHAYVLEIQIPASLC